MIVELEMYCVEEEFGLWCDHCLLPSVARFVLVHVFAESLAVLDRNEVRACESCGVLQ